MLFSNMHLLRKTVEEPCFIYRRVHFDGKSNTKLKFISGNNVSTNNCIKIPFFTADVSGFSSWRDISWKQQLHFYKKEAGVNGRAMGLFLTLSCSINSELLLSQSKQHCLEDFVGENGLKEAWDLLAVDECLHRGMEVLMGQEYTQKEWPQRTWWKGSSCITPQQRECLVCFFFQFLFFNPLSLSRP